MNTKAAKNKHLFDRIYNATHTKWCLCFFYYIRIDFLMCTAHNSNLCYINRIIEFEALQCNNESIIWIVFFMRIYIANPCERCRIGGSHCSDTVLKYSTLAGSQFMVHSSQLTNCPEIKFSQSTGWISTSVRFEKCLCAIKRFHNIYIPLIWRR